MCGKGLDHVLRPLPVVGFECARSLPAATPGVIGGGVPANVAAVMFVSASAP